MDRKLHRYKEKRDFNASPEPEGEIKASEGRLRFVIQHHLARRDHYDFRLEWDGVLLSWAVPKGPSYHPRDKRLAIRVEDHPLEYRNFEGTIPKGEYGGGVVMLWDEGIWEPDGDVEKGLREGMLKFLLKGRRLKGNWALIRMKGKPKETKENWLLLKERDEYAKTTEGISEFITSIRTGRTMEEIQSGQDEKITRNPFTRVDVQLAKLVKKVPQGEDWIYELKYDGYRIVAFVEGNQVRLITRKGNDYTKYFHDIATSLAEWADGRAMVLDGEMVVTDPSGRTDFQALQTYMKNPKGKNLTYIVFDLLALDGVDLRGKPLIDRLESMESIMKDAPRNLYLSRYVRGKGEESFAAACKAKLEGIVGKRIHSVYEGGRNDDWIKIKCDKRQEFVIGGYTLSDKRSQGVSSLLLGIYEGEDLVYVGRAGTGISESDRKMLEKQLMDIKKLDPPFKQAPKPRPKERITWLEPELVAEIKFAQWTKDGLLRQASFKGLRTDKDPKDIRKEVPEDETPLPSPSVRTERSGESKMKDVTIGGIRITNPDRVVYEDTKITKEDVAKYYLKVSQRILPFVANRILSVLRCPKGISQTCFYRKHPHPGNKGVKTLPLTTGSGETEDYFYIVDTSGLISEVQMGTLEFHTWGSRIQELEKPDIMVFDLDPDEDLELSRVRQGVQDIKSILDQLSLKSYLKTSGGKGYHVVVPFEPSVTWDTFYRFARNIARVMEEKWPDRYTSNIRKSQRTDKIFIDWIRNQRGATSIAPYSLRARKGARVSMPLTWDELNRVAPDGVNMADAIGRMDQEDPWKDFFQNKQRLK